MAQQIAMQTLIAWGDEMLLKHPQKILSFGEAIDKAVELLQMEKEQMVNFGNDLLAQNDINYIGVPDLAEQYYNETFTSTQHNGNPSAT